jgi:2',3'-cyclic-nucleotide 2'-phosphodiesterase (5'-nucleotidase family)
MGMRRLLMAVGIVLMAVSQAAAGRAATAPIHVTILHFNDAYDIAPPSGQGGWAEAATLIRLSRIQDINTIVTYGGDLISPSFISSMTQGTHMIALMNDIGVDYAAFGSHDFDFGPEILEQRIAESKFVWLATNVRDADGKPFAGVHPVALRHIGSVTLGFFALLAPSTAVESSPGPGVNFLPPELVATEAVAKLRAAGCDVVIALTHQPLDDDKALVKAVPGIDLVLGGDEKEPMAIEQDGVPILRTGINLKVLARVEMTIDKPKDGPAKITKTYRLVPTSGVKPNAKIDAEVSLYESDFEKELGQPVATLASPLDSRMETVRTAESSIGDLIAEAMLAASGADAAIMNAGGIRGDRLYAQGSELTRRDIQRELPFDNRLIVVEVPGSAILAALENGVSQLATQAGRFPQVAGLTFTLDPGKPAGKRVSKVTIGGKPIDPKKIYRLAINDYMARGGDGYDMLGKAKRLDLPGTSRPLTEVVIDYLKGKGEVAVEPGERIRRIQ